MCQVDLRAVARGGIFGGWLTPPPTFVELTYSQNRFGHSENYGNNSITKFSCLNRENIIKWYC